MRRRKCSRVADSRGNTYQRAVGPTVRRRRRHAEHLLRREHRRRASRRQHGHGDILTGGRVFADVRIAEYRGIATANPVDVTAGAQGSSTTSSSGAVTTTNANDLLVGANTGRRRDATGAGRGVHHRASSPCRTATSSKIGS